MPPRKRPIIADDLLDALLAGTDARSAFDARQHAVAPLLTPLRHRGRIDAFAPQNGADLAGVLAGIQFRQQCSLVGGGETAPPWPCRHLQIWR